MGGDVLLMMPNTQEKKYRGLKWPLLAHVRKQLHQVGTEADEEFPSPNLPAQA